MRTKNFIRNLAGVMATSLAMMSCGVVFDDEVDCEDPVPTTYQVRFRYDMNMKYADAFAHEVHAVTLLVLDSNGQLVTRLTEEGSALAEEGYTMTVPVSPGNYQLLAWCSTNEQDTYTINTSGRALDFNCTLNSTSARDYSVSHDLDPLYHGLVTNASFPDEPGTHTVTVPLTKDTNRIRVGLVQANGIPLSTDMFTFDITADNAVLDYENTVIPDHHVTYYPWYTSTATTNVIYSMTGISDTDTSSDSEAENAIVAELTVSRLVTEDDPRLTVVNNETGNVVFSIPLKDYILLFKGHENASMDDQEFLDRQDEYNLTFFLNEDGQWISSYIYINAWRIVLNKSTL